ncbi:MAG TPA: MgtC/SapB family protein [Gaiellaceae bacterium]|nr:MgtC/SapB family protein [Gaiellaceae bacterium]
MLLLATDVAHLGWGGALARLVVAGALGAVLGFERELHEREAGLRTHLMVAIGAALFTIVSAYGFDDVLGSSGPSVLVRLDPSRVAAQVVTGIGFLGAGAIIRHGIGVRGLTTAASLWVAAAIGMAAGAGYWAGAVFATAIGLVVLWPLRRVTRALVARFRGSEEVVVVELEEGRPVSTVLDAVNGLRRVEIATEGGRIVLELELAEPDPALLGQLSAIDGVVGVRWEA